MTAMLLGGQRCHAWPAEPGGSAEARRSWWACRSGPGVPLFSASAMLVYMPKRLCAAQCFEHNLKSGHVGTCACDKLNPWHAVTAGIKSMQARMPRQAEV